MNASCSKSLFVCLPAGEFQIVSFLSHLGIGALCKGTVLPSPPLTDVFSHELRKLIFISVVVHIAPDLVVGSQSSLGWLSGICRTPHPC